MGTIDLLKISKFSGRIGPIIVYETKKGQQIIRSYTKPMDPKTPKQLAHRAKFGLANKELAPLHTAIVVGHGGDGRAYRKAIGRAYHEAVAGTYPDFYIDYSKIQIAEGKLQLPSDIRVDLDWQAKLAKFRWNREIENTDRPGRDSDKLFVVSFDRSFPQEVDISPLVIRKMGEATVELPAHWNAGTLHFWLFFISYDGRNISDSVYLKAK